MSNLDFKSAPRGTATPDVSKQTSEQRIADQDQRHRESQMRQDMLFMLLGAILLGIHAGSWLVGIGVYSLAIGVYRNPPKE